MEFEFPHAIKIENISHTSGACSFFKGFAILCFSFGLFQLCISHLKSATFICINLLSIFHFKLLWLSLFVFGTNLSLSLLNISHADFAPLVLVDDHDMAGLFGSLARVNKYSKKQCRILFWKMRAALKKTVDRGGGKRRFRFQYDPSSYALNFDDGSNQLGGFYQANNKVQSCYTSSTWIYVIWVES